MGVIGGSGLYEIEGLKDVAEVKIKTPFGDPSDVFVLGTLSGVRCAFLPRHGRGHSILPGEINNRANLYALKVLGVNKVIAVSACGSLKEDISPRTLVIPDQLFDRTQGRISTFFGNGIVAHISFDEPFCTELSLKAASVSKRLNLPLHQGGAYVCIQGPAFSTKAESEVNRKLGFSVVGMTALPEAKLARECEMCYCTLAFVTDYDVWKAGEEVSVETVIGNLNFNVNNAKALLKELLPELGMAGSCKCTTALASAIFTSPSAIGVPVKKRLGLLVGNYLK